METRGRIRGGVVTCKNVPFLQEELMPKALTPYFQTKSESRAGISMPPPHFTNFGGSSWIEMMKGIEWAEEKIRPWKIS